MILAWLIFFVIMMIGFHKVTAKISYTSKLGLFLLIIGAIGYVGVAILAIVLDILK